MKHGSLFSGIGGFDLAAEWMGWENVFHCEWNPFGQRILKHYWPNAKSYNDITKTDFTQHRGAIDILTGGFPCQPYSLAGKRKGKADDRHLWPEMLRAIREIQPQWVVGENVFGIVNWNEGMVFDEVQADLEAEGYEVQPYVLPACAVNAPHRRDRVWFVAYTKSFRERSGSKKQGEYKTSREQLERAEQGRNDNDNGTGWLTQNPDSHGRPGEQREEEPGIGEQRDAGTRDNERVSADNGKAGVVADTEPTGRKGADGLCQSFRFKPETWHNWPKTEPTICGRNDGLPEYLDGITFSKWRNESIKAYGNAIVPQVALQIFKSIEAYSSFK